MLPTPPGQTDPFADFDQFLSSYQKPSAPPPPPDTPPAAAPAAGADPFSDFDQFLQPLLQERQIEQSTGMPATPISPLLNRPMIPGVAEGVESSLQYGEGTRSQPTMGEKAASVLQAIPSGAQRQLGGLGEYLQALASAGETPGLQLPIPAEVVSAPLRAIGETLEAGQGAYFRNNQAQEIQNQRIAEQNPVTGFAQDVAGQIPQMAMALGMGGGAPALAALGASAAGSEMQRAESMGADPGQALAAGTMSGAIEAATEMFGKVGLASRAFQAAEAGAPVTRGALETIARDIAENFGQEVAASVGQRFTQLAVYEDGTYGWQDVKSALYDGLVGAAVGGGMSTATQGIGRVANRLPSNQAPQKAQEEADFLAEQVARARAERAQQQAQDAATVAQEAPPPVAEPIPVPEVAPLPPQPEIVPQEVIPPQAAATPAAEAVPVQAAPVVQTVVEEPAPPPVEVVAEPVPPPAPPVQPEPVAPPTQVAPQEAQNGQDAQADFAQGGRAALAPATQEGPDRPPEARVLAPTPEAVRPVEAPTLTKQKAINRWQKAETGKPVTLLAWHVTDTKGKTTLTPYAKERAKRDSLLGPGWYGALEKEDTEKFGEATPHEVTLQNPYVIEENDYNRLLYLENAKLDEIRAAGHDGLIVKAKKKSADGTPLGYDRRARQVVVFPKQAAPVQEAPDALRQQEGTQEGRQEVAPAPPVQDGPVPEAAVPSVAAPAEAPKAKFVKEYSNHVGRRFARFEVNGRTFDIQVRAERKGFYQLSRAQAKQAAIDRYLSEQAPAATEALAAPIPAAPAQAPSPAVPSDAEAMAVPIPAPVAAETRAARVEVGVNRDAINDQLREEAETKIQILEEKIARAEAKRTPRNSESTDRKIEKWQDKIEDIELDLAAKTKAPISAEPPAKERPAGAEDVDETKPPAEPKSLAEDALNARRDAVFGPIQPTTTEGKRPTVAIGSQGTDGGKQPTNHRMTRLPDLVKLAKQMMGGLEVASIPKRMREGLLGLANFKGRFLRLNPETAKTPGLAEAVLAHEIGHLADMFKERVSPVFDRILKIRKALQDLGGNATVKRRKQLIEGQALELAREWARRSPIQMPEHVIESDYFERPSEVYANVVGAILNDPELARQIAPDLYVDFMARIDADPELSDSWRFIQEHMARPEEEKVAERLEDQREEERKGVDARLRGIRQKLLPESVTKLQKMLKGWISTGLARYWDKRSPSYRAGRYVAGELRKAGDESAADRVLQLLEKMQWALEDADHFFSRVAAYFDMFNQFVMSPLEAKGLTSADLSLALRLIDQEANPHLFGPQGIRGEEATRLLNQSLRDMGEDKSAALVEAIQDYWVLRSTILSRFAMADTETQEAIEHILENSAYARRTSLEILQAEASESAKAGGGPTNIEGSLLSALKHREGSLKATGHALAETLLVDAALMRAAERGLARKHSIEFLKSADMGTGELIQEAKPTGPGTYEKPPVGWELLRTRERGRSVGYFVPESIYKGIEKAPADTASVMRSLDYVNRILRPLLVTHNPAWALFNVQRDFWAAYKHHTNPNIFTAFGETLSQAVIAGRDLGRLYLQARGETSKTPGKVTQFLPEALRGWVSGLTQWEQMRTLTEQEMAMQAAILTMPESRSMMAQVAAQLDTSQMDELQAFRAIFDLALRKQLGGPLSSVSDVKANKFVQAMEWIERHAKPMAALGMASERAVKIAGYRMLTQRKAKLEAKRAAGTLSKRQAEELSRLSQTGYIPRVVRSRMGSPDFLRRGLEYNNYNRWLLFSNAAKEGLRSSIEAAKDDPAGYAVKTMMVNVMPKLITAWLVANDDDFREWYRGLPQWLRMNFTPIPAPLALGPNGESRYIPLPQDFTGAFINGLLDVLLIQGLIEDRPVTSKKLLQALNPLFVYSLASLNPGLETAIQAALLMNGINPPDLFRGRNMFDPFTFDSLKENEIELWSTFAKEAWKNMGFSLIYRPPSPWEDAKAQEQEWWEKTINRMPVLGNMVRRLRGSTDAGRREEAYEVLSPARAEKSEEREARKEYIRQALEKDPERPDREIAEETYKYLVEEKGFTDATKASHIIAVVRALRDQMKWGTKSPDQKILDIGKTKAEERILRERFGIPEDEE